jgi:DNA-binding LacI/PurR family transcriptional regulator
MKTFTVDITIKGIAKRAGVSIATVSRAINPETRALVAPETLEKIQSVVRKQKYTPNLAAKNLRSTKTKTIGLLMPHIKELFISDFYMPICAGASTALLGTDYRLKPIALDPQNPKWDGYHFHAMEGVDGVVASYWQSFFTKKLSLDVPCVGVCDPVEGVKAHIISSDNLRGGETAARYLYEKGHERIAILAGFEFSTDSRLRIEGFRKFMRSVGTAIPQEMVFTANFEESEAARLVEKIWLEKHKITAFFCVNDNMACGVMRKLKQLRVRVPEDVSVMGYDDQRLAQYTDPPLTTVHVPLMEMGELAANKLIAYLKGEYHGKFIGGSTLLPVSLIERKSVKSVG